MSRFAAWSSLPAGKMLETAGSLDNMLKPCPGNRGSARKVQACAAGGRFFRKRHMRNLIVPGALVLLAAAGCSGIERGSVKEIEQRNVQILSAQGEMVFKEKADIASGKILIGYKELIHRKCEQRKLYELVEEGRPVGEEYSDWEEAEGKTDEFSSFIVTKLKINGADADHAKCDMGKDNILTIDLYKLMEHAKAGQKMNFEVWYALRGDEKKFEFHVNENYVTAMIEVRACRQGLEDNPLSAWWRFRMAAAYYRFDYGNNAFKEEVERRFKEHVGYERKWNEVMADAYGGAGRNPESGKLFEEIASREDEVNSAFHYAVKACLAYEKASMFDDCLRLYMPYWRKPLTKPNRAHLSNNIGVMLDRKGRKSRAFLYFRYSTILEPGNSLYKSNQKALADQSERNLTTKIDQAYADDLNRAKGAIESSNSRLAQLKANAEEYVRQQQYYINEANQATATYNANLYNEYASFTRAQALSRRDRAISAAQDAERNYNSTVAEHNQELSNNRNLVNQYNALVERIQQVVNAYNTGLDQYNAAYKLIEAGNYRGAFSGIAEALRLFSAVINENSRIGIAKRMRSMCRFQEGFCHYNLKDSDRAFEAFMACFEEDFSVEAALTNIAVVLVSKVQGASREEALALVEEAILFDPNNARAQELYGQLSAQ